MRTHTPPALDWGSSWIQVWLVQGQCLWSHWSSLPVSPFWASPKWGERDPSSAETGESGNWPKEWGGRDRVRRGEGWGKEWGWRERTSGKQDRGTAWEQCVVVRVEWSGEKQRYASYQETGTIYISRLPYKVAPQVMKDQTNSRLPST